MNEPMRFIDPDTLGSIRESSLAERVQAIHSAAEVRFGADGYKVEAVHDATVTMIRGSDAAAIKVAFMLSEDGIDFGHPESIRVESFQSEEEWAKGLVEKTIDAIASGSHELTRTRLHSLSEAVGRGNAYTSEGILRSLKERLEAKSTWVDVYSSREREIRSYVHGEIERLRESIPSARFRVLATDFAPENPEQYREELIGSFKQVLATYEGVVDTLEHIDREAGDFMASFIEADRGMLLQNLTGFVASLRESASSVSRYGTKYLRMESDGDLPRLSRLHDLLAEGLEDYLISTTFVRKLVSDITSSESTQ